MLDQCKKGRKQTGNICNNGNLFTNKKRHRARLIADMQARIYNDGKHLTVLLIRWAHTLRRTLRRFIERSPPPERERRAGGHSSRGYLHVEGRECSAVRHLLLVVRLGPQSHAWGSRPWRKPSGAVGVPGRRSGSWTGPRKTPRTPAKCRAHTNQLAPPKELSFLLQDLLRTNDRTPSELSRLLSTELSQNPQRTLR